MRFSADSVHNGFFFFFQFSPGAIVFLRRFVASSSYGGLAVGTPNNVNVISISEPCMRVFAFISFSHFLCVRARDECELITAHSTFGSDVFLQECVANKAALNCCAYDAEVITPVFHSTPFSRVSLKLTKHWARQRQPSVEMFPKWVHLI